MTPPPNPDQDGSLPPLPGGRIELAPGVTIPESAIRLQYSRSSGPGGQNVNKVNTRAQLWAPIAAISGLSESAIERLRGIAPSRITAEDEILIEAEVERTQEGNRQAVFDRLRDLIEQARKEPKRRRRTKPSRAAKERRVKAKRQRGEVKSKRRYRAADE
jgi:ribosome-associated protein